MSVPWLSAAPPGSVEVVAADAKFGVSVDCFEQDLLTAHADFGCISVWCLTEAGAYPFVFVHRLVWQLVACFQLVYCRDIADFVRFARPLGRYLALRGRPFGSAGCDWSGAWIGGAIFRRGKAKMLQGPYPPRPGDLSYTEASLFGI